MAEPDEKNPRMRGDAGKVRSGKLGLPKIDNGQNKLPGKSVTDAVKGASNDNLNAVKGKDKDQAEDDKILRRAKKNFDRCVQAESEDRKDALDDIKFVAGEAQWSADVMARRNFDKRPCLTINRLPTILHQVTNDIRQNRPDIMVSPVGERSDKDSAKIFRGMIRAVERASASDIAYDTATWSAVASGLGYIRLNTAFEAPDTFDQVARIERIRNRFTTYLDPSRQEPDAADAKFGFITETIPRSEFEDEYPDATPMPFQQAGMGDNLKNWVTENEIRVAEYFEITEKKSRLVALSNGFTGWYDDLSDDVKESISDEKIEIIRERDSAKPKLMWYKITALEILERQELIWDSIPIVPVIGEEIDIEGKVKYYGIVRNTKDSQRMYNYAATTEIEVTMLAPKAHYIMEEGQLEGHEDEWKAANTSSSPVLTYKGTNLEGGKAPPPQRSQVSPIPAGIVSIRQTSAQDIMATSGVRFDSSPADQKYDESGRQIIELRRSNDLGSFHFSDNLARALRRIGNMLVKALPKLYDTKRTMVILREDDSEERITVDPHQQQAVTQQRDQETGKIRRAFNPSVGDYGVTVTIGASYATKRIEAAEQMLKFAQAMPQTAQLIADLIANEMDWPGGEKIAARLAKALPPNLLTPDMKDVPPQVQAMLSSMDQQIKKLTMELQQAMKALQDKGADRQVKLEKINSDFEAKLLAIVQKSEDSENKNVRQELRSLADGVNVLHDMLSVEPDRIAIGSDGTKTGVAA